MFHRRSLLCLLDVALDILLLARSSIGFLLIIFFAKFDLSDFCQPRVQTIFGTLQPILAVGGLAQLILDPLPTGLRVIPAVRESQLNLPASRATDGEPVALKILWFQLSPPRHGISPWGGNRCTRCRWPDFNRRRSGSLDDIVPVPHANLLDNRRVECLVLMQ